MQVPHLRLLEEIGALISRETSRWRSLYAHRVMVEWSFGELKHEWSMLPLRVRGRDRVQLHVDLTILARLGHALLKTEAVTVAA